jgi:hypothetical protein
MPDVIACPNPTCRARARILDHGNQLQIDCAGCVLARRAWTGESNLSDRLPPVAPRVLAA